MRRKAPAIQSFTLPCPLGQDPEMGGAVDRQCERRRMHCFLRSQTPSLYTLCLPCRVGHDCLGWQKKRGHVGVQQQSPPTWLGTNTPFFLPWFRSRVQHDLHVE